MSLALPPEVEPLLSYTDDAGGNLTALALLARIAARGDLPPGMLERLRRMAVCHDDEPLHFCCTPFPSWGPDPRAWSCEADRSPGTSPRAHG